MRTYDQIVADIPVDSAVDADEARSQLKPLDSCDDSKKYTGPDGFGYDSERDHVANQMWYILNVPNAGKAYTEPDGTEVYWNAVQGHPQILDHEGSGFRCVEEARSKDGSSRIGKWIQDFQLSTADELREHVA